MQPNPLVLLLDEPAAGVPEAERGELPDTLATVETINAPGLHMAARRLIGTGIERLRVGL
ncbi:hypothetical protein [uncultured Paracoccus sp.]|uniref:hypothetical protein n=1 Tax=uncultured Paracoccus sp. TaxID=189685 RepID=UPI0025EE352A|nr:hypothetical protein [uncultured Paracoccus sp.]